jgi:hypothetical protein
MVESSTPQMNRSGETPGLRPLFHSVRDIALILDKTLKAGYGNLLAGTILSVDAIGNIAPYAEADVAANGGNAKAYLAVDGTATPVVVIQSAEAYKFAVGDPLSVNDSANGVQDLGLITDITHDANTGLATVTCDGANPTAPLVASNANVYLTPAGTPVLYVLDQDVDSGAGMDAKGANTSVVVSNAVLYKSLLSSINYDAAALSALGAMEDGRFVILK